MMSLFAILRTSSWFLLAVIVTQGMGRRLALRSDNRLDETCPFLEGENMPQFNDQQAAIYQRLWPGKTLVYEFGRSFSLSERNIVLKAMMDIEIKTCIKFIPRSKEKDYVHITSTGSGCSSAVGRTRGPQILNLGKYSNCVTHGIVQHELLHALGLEHEHTRPDRNCYVQIHWHNIRNGSIHNFDINKNGWMYGPYDYGSLMHYSETELQNSTGRLTIVSTLQNNAIGQRDGVSTIDVLKLNKLYSCEAPPLSRVDHLALYRPGTGTIWILRNQNGRFSPVYQQGSPGIGIGGYDLFSVNDRVISFDYNHAKKQDHLALYRPGTGTIWILGKDSNGNFRAVYKEGDPGTGIGGYDLRSGADRIFAFDYQSTGMLDHLVLYRPGTGTMWILRNTRGTFLQVYAQGAPGNGIGGYNLQSSSDRSFAFDFDHSGKLDHLVLYRPGTGTVWILKNTNGNFKPVYAEGDPGQGIGGYDLWSPRDRMLAFDYDGKGKLDHLVLYRPGTGTIWILENDNGIFSAVYRQGDPGRGIGGYDLQSYADRVFAFDYDRSGKSDHLVLYRPGTGTLWILKNTNGVFRPVYQQGDPGNGIGGFDLKSSRDLAFAFNFEGV